MTWGKQGGEYKRRKKTAELPARRRRQGVVLQSCQACGRPHAHKAPGTPDTGSALKDEPGCSTKCTNDLRSAAKAQKRRQTVAKYLAWRQAIKEAA